MCFDVFKLKMYFIFFLQYHCISKDGSIGKNQNTWLIPEDIMWSQPVTVQSLVTAGLSLKKYNKISLI